MSQQKHKSFQKVQALEHTSNLPAYSIMLHLWGRPSSEHGEPRAGLAVALGVIIKQKHSLQKSNSINSTASYAEAHTCPNFMDAGQATLQQDRKPSSSQPNIFEELSMAELAAVVVLHTESQCISRCICKACMTAR